MTIIKGVPRPDGWEWQDLEPAERLRYAKALAARKIPLLQEGSAKRSARENQAALERAVPFRTGALYQGRCNFANSVYFELIDDQNVVTIHARTWFTGGRFSVHIGDEVSVVYKNWPSAEAWWRIRCKGCLINWQLPKRTYCQECLDHCRWCNGLATSALFGRPVCLTCIERWEPHRNRMNDKTYRYRGDLCFWCNERKATEYVYSDSGIWRTWAGYSCCAVCLPEIENWDYPRGHDATKTYSARDLGFCEECHNGYIEYFLEYAPYPNRKTGSYRCRYCKGGSKVIARIPALILAGNLLRYEEDPNDALN